MQFQHRSFDIDCWTTHHGELVVGEAKIWRPATDDRAAVLFESGYLRSFATETAAIRDARFWAKLWCDKYQ